MTPREIALRIIRMYAKTAPDQRHARLVQVMTEGHGPAFFEAIQEAGMLSPLVESATGKTGLEAFTLAQQLINAAANANLFPRDETGGVVYPAFRPVGEYGAYLEKAQAKSVLDEFGESADPSALFSAYNIPSL